MTRLLTEDYAEQVKGWPRVGRHLLAQFDAETVSDEELRPHVLDGFIGQPRLKAQLQLLLDAARKRDLTVVIYGQALPEGEEYKTRVVLVSEEPPGEEIITETKKRFIGDDLVQAVPRSRYVVDVFIDHYVNGQVVEPIFFGESVYPGNPGRRLVGIQPTPTPIPSETPTPSAGTP